jgi:UTRA domain
MSRGTGGGAVQGGAAGPSGPARPSVQVLADRLAAGLTRREPGYPLPRRSALARRFQVTIAEIDAAIEELVGRQLLRRLPTGELHRAGPAEYLVNLDGLPGLSSFIDPMDHAVSCSAVRVSRLRASEDVAEALGLPSRAQVVVRRCLWTADGEPAASLTTYIPVEYADIVAVSPAGEGGEPEGCPPLATALAEPGTLAGSGVQDRPVTSLYPGAVRIEVQPPPRSVARRLRLASGSPAVIVTARLDVVLGAGGTRVHDGDGDDGDGGAGSQTPGVPPQVNPAAHGPARPGGGDPRREPVVLTVLALRPELFRVVLDLAGPGGEASRASHGSGATVPPGVSGQAPRGAGNLEPRWQPAAQQRGSAYRGAGAT